MPRILIADDNSNIQRMAALALKDAGIEVIAVGNGEAAVRKLREISPDLVLADIFMPVRNGYEVCEFIKHDPKLSNIPVLLLAGAFDPFDEREAQRVQADGILKKPFVPPDPLINAVKTLLEKSAGERLMAVTVPADASASATAESATSTAATTAAVATVAEQAAPPIEDAEGQAYAEPLSVVDFLSNSTADAVKEKPASFSASPSFEIPQLDEPEPVVTAPRDPVLGEPAFWTPEEVEQEAAHTVEDSPEDLVDHTWGSSGRPAPPMRDDPDPPMMLELEPPKSAIHDFDLEDFAAVQPEPVHEAVKESVTNSVASQSYAFDLPPLPATPEAPQQAESAPEASISDSDSLLPSAPPATVAALEIHAPSAPPPHAMETSAEDTLPLPAAVVESTELEMTPLQDSLPPQAEAKPEEAESLFALDAPFVRETAPPVAGATTIEPPAIAVTEDDESPLLELEESSLAYADVAEPASKSSAFEPVPAIKQKVSESEVASDWPPVFVPFTSASAHEPRTPSADAPASSIPVAIDEVAAALAPEPATIAALSPEAQEAVIQRVIERMQPQIVELVTRQILRPLVESLVRSELNK